MDPKACLDEAEEAIGDSDWTVARDRIHDYQRWRIGGGFEPDGGDARLEQLIEAFINKLLPFNGPSNYCWKCNGSGEGVADGTSCPVCGGSGEEEE